ncbi:MAG: precorrin-3B synthase [Rhodobacter sp.]|nr:precorrin-3B synthase [Rhodobacter sp.]
MSGFEVKGWCPGALRPMLSGDGWLVRIRPPGGRLSRAQAEGIARAALAHGNGIIDLSARANLQLRGVSETSHGPLIADLDALGLIDPDIETESLRNLIVTPFRDEETETLATGFAKALTRLPRLPGKFGFALDCGPRPVLTNASADIRVERSADGQLILRPDGHPFGKPVTDLGTDVLSMADWFLTLGGMTNGRGRMAALIGRGMVPDGCNTPPAEPLSQPGPGLHPAGALVALAFGQMAARTLAVLAALSHEIRPTPWRMLMLAGVKAMPVLPEVIASPDDPLLQVMACTGAPGCPQALGETRSLARSLAGHIPHGRHLHVSGCAKGCAHPGPTDLTLVASTQGYDLVRGGTASDTPERRGLSPAALPDLLKAQHAPPL